MTNPSAAMRRGLSPARFGGAVSVVGLSMVLAAMQAASAAGPGATPITLGRVLGLTAAYGALIQVILRARIPSIERGFGVRVLGQWHACLGGTVVLLAVGHALLISTGYAAAAHTTIAGEFSALVAQYPWLPEALAALLILISVAALATRRTRRVFRYEAWHLIHCSVYVAVLLALGHQLLVGDSFQHGMPSRTAWLVLYLVTVGMVLWFRVLRPFWISLRHHMVIEDVVQESADVVSVIISGRNLDSLHVQAGQFFRWRFLTRGQWQAAHPYSLSLPPALNKMRITVKAAGRHSRRIAALHPGTRVVAEGPCGGFTAARRRRANVLLIAGGIGITPLRALYQSLTPTDGVIRLLYRASTEQDVLFRDELAAIAESDGKELTLLVGRRAQLGYDPLAISRLCTLVPDLSHCDVFLCGPRGMAVTIRDQLRTAEFDCRHLFTESFGL